MKDHVLGLGTALLFVIMLTTIVEGLVLLICWLILAPFGLWHP